MQVESVAGPLQGWEDCKIVPEIDFGHFQSSSVDSNWLLPILSEDCSSLCGNLNGTSNQWRPPSLFNQPFGVSEQHHFQKLLNSKPSLAIFQTIQLHVLLSQVSAVIPTILPSFLVELMVSNSCTTWNAWKVCQIVGTPMKFNSSPLKNGDWEDKPFLLGFSIFFISKNVKLQGSL